MTYTLGADVGGTKTHLVIADREGSVVGFGEGGPGNHQDVGYDGLYKTLDLALQQALDATSIRIEQVVGAGFGLGGYDWLSEKEDNLKVIRALGLNVPVDIVNDAVLGLPAGAREGWGVAVVSGTGCNCWGWDRTRQHIGRVTGYGDTMGEAAGASELVSEAVKAVAHQWTKRGPATALTPALLKHTGAASLEELVEGLATRRFELDNFAAPLIFQVAAAGDPVATSLIQWAGRELGELANSVIRQLDFQPLDFDVVLVGSMFNNGAMLIEPMRNTIQSLAPKARLVKLDTLPVAGAVLLGAEAAGLEVGEGFRRNLITSLARIRQAG